MALPTPKKAWSRSQRDDIQDKRKNPSQTQDYEVITHAPEHSKKSRWWRLFFVILLVLVILARAFKSDLGEFLSNPDIEIGHEEKQDDSKLSVGLDNISVRWPLERVSWQLYTHRVDDATYGLVGLRSSSSLSGLSGDIEFIGKVVDYIDDIYVLEVSKIIHHDLETMYFEEPWLLIKNIINDGFVVEQVQSSNQIRIENPVTSAFILIGYEPCSLEDWESCKTREQSLEERKGEQLTDSYGVVYHLLPDELSWYANIEERYGVTIEVSQPELFPFIIERIQFITTTRAEEKMLTTLKSYCKSWDISLTTIDSGSISQEGEEFSWTVTGSDNNNNFIQCRVDFHPNNLETATVSVLASDYVAETDDEIDTDTSTGSAEEDDDTSTEIIDTNELEGSWVEQFPLRKDSPLVFETRGLEIVFPSPNIAYETQNITSGPNNESCSAVTNVIDYPHADLRNEQPTLRIYFCAAGTTTSKDMRNISYEDGVLLIEVVDAWRVDFANAITLN